VGISAAVAAEAAVGLSASFAPALGTVATLLTAASFVASLRF
jgi:hypothetical protein